ncbi:hypothetical protein GCM10010381_57330 [Streptomyces xantholiticus]|nr:hypothetical protein GCM10010381_57330 [Streptomyces xantholiticus]
MILQPDGRPSLSSATAAGGLPGGCGAACATAGDTTAIVSTAAAVTHVFRVRINVPPPRPRFSGTLVCGRLSTSEDGERILWVAWGRRDMVRPRPGDEVSPVRGPFSGGAASAVEVPAGRHAQDLRELLVLADAALDLRRVLAVALQ